MGLFHRKPVATRSSQDDMDFASPRRLAVSGDERLLAVAARENCVRVWDTASGKLRYTLDLDDQGNAVALSRDGAFLVAGTIGSRQDARKPVCSNLFAWSLAGSSPKLLWQVRQFGAPAGIVLDPKGQWCATAVVYGRLNVFDLRTGDLQRICTEVGHGMSDVVISDDGQTVVTAGDQLKLWEPVSVPLPRRSLPVDVQTTEAQSRRFLRARHGSWATVLAMSPDSTWVAAQGSFQSMTGHAETLARVDIARAKVIEVLSNGLSDVKSLAVSPDGNLIALGYDSPKVELRTIPGGDMARTFDLGDFGRVRSLAFLSGGKQIAIASQHGTKVEIRATTSGGRIREFPSAP